MCAALLTDDLDQLLKKLIEQWNIAERRIKKAEQVRGNEVVISAIFELRYAGRKLVDSLEITCDENWREKNESREAIHRYLADAIEDCVKSKHDSIDAMLDFVTRWFYEVEKTLGLEELQKYFPSYMEVTGKIDLIQERIAESRGNRHLGRDQIYDEVEQDGYDEILALFSNMRTSKSRIEQSIRKDKRNRRFLFWAAILGPIFSAILSVVATVLLF
jgi:hypothetical protein